MSPLESPDLEVPRKSIRTTQQLIRDHVRRAMCRSQDAYVGHDRRRKPRIPFPYPIFLTPFDADGKVESEKTFTVIGRHLSECGLDFYYHEPVTEKNLVFSLDASDDETFGIVMELTWCRFLHPGWYQNGGRFVSTTPLPSRKVKRALDFQLNGCP